MTKGRALVLAALGLAVFLGLWQSLGTFGLLNPTLAPPPTALPKAFLNEWRTGHWQSSVASSLNHYARGLLFGSLAGILVGIGVGLSKSFEAGQLWVMRVLRPIPTLAWIPFAIMWFGVDEAAATFIIAIYVFWINYFATIGAVRAVDPDLIELAAAFGHRSTISQIVKIVLPAAAPGILNGLRTGIGQAWMAVVAAELFGIPGIGARMTEASGLLASPVVVVYMLTIAALYGVSDAAFSVFTRVMLPWQR